MQKKKTYKDCCQDIGFFNSQGDSIIIRLK